MSDRWSRSVLAARRTGTPVTRASIVAVARRAAVPLAYLALAVSVLRPALGPGYVLTLDMIVGPHTDFVGSVLHTKGPLYYGRLPLAAVLDALAVVLPVWAIQQGVLLGIVAGAGRAAHRALGSLHPRRSPALPARLFAGTLYAVNPFVHVRLAAGHWYFLLGYALLPLALAAFADYLAGRTRLRRAVAWTTLVSIADPHAALLLAVSGACVVGVGLWRPPTAGADGRHRLAAGTGRFAGVAAACNAFWLLPALAVMTGGADRLSRFSGLDVVAFAPSGTLAGNVPLSLAALYGFWRAGGAGRLPVAELGLEVTLALLAALLALAVYGLLGGRDASARGPLAGGVALAAAVGFLLALGATHPIVGPAVRAVTRAVPPLAGMRDSQKHVALLALAYALLGGLGVDRLWREHRARRAPAGDSGGGSTHASRWQRRRRTVVAVVLAGCLLAVPLAYAGTTLDGTGGALERTTYPAGYHAADERIDDGTGGAATASEPTRRVLFLPWHGYLHFEWAGGTLATPAAHAFRAPVVDGESLDVGGIRDRASDPTSLAVRAALADAGIVDGGSGSAELDGDGRLAERLAAVGVGHVALARTADHRRAAAALDDAPELTRVATHDTLVVYRNEAYDPELATGATADGTVGWPRVGPVVPRGALGAGLVVSGLTALGLAGGIGRSGAPGGTGRLARRFGW